MIRTMAGPVRVNRATGSPRPGHPRRARRSRAPVAAVLALLLAGPVTAQATIVEVTLCTDTTPVSVPGELRHALNSGGKLLILLPPCRITLTGFVGENANEGGDLDVGPVFLHLQGAGVDRTILDGAGLDRVLDIVGASVTVSDLTLTNGSASPGGALKIAGSRVDLTRVAVTGSRAPGGGFGGGIDIAGSTVRMTESTVAGHESGAGGGLALSNTRLTLEASTVSGNRATGAFDSAGGGLLVTASSVTLRQATLSGNRAEGSQAIGAGLRAFLSEVDALLVTVTGNTADGAAATGGAFETPGSEVAVQGSIVAGNHPDNCGGGAPVTSADHNLQDGASCPFTRANDQSQPDLGLAPLALNGGLTATHLPLPGSPALDRGPTLGCPGLDQRGVSRPRDGDGDGAALCDVGAAERSPPGAGRTSLPKVLDPR